MQYLLALLVLMAISLSGDVLAEEEPAEEAEEAEEEDWCHDNDADCPTWASNGECAINVQYMHEHCKKSCGVCGFDDISQISYSESIRHHQGGDMGVAQQLSFPDGTREEDIFYLIAKARNYMRQVVSNQFEEGMIDLCQTKHHHCAWWALLGECSKNPSYMMDNCAPMCNSCHALTLEHKCPLDPDAPNAWAPGDLDKMFERLTSEPYKTQNAVEILSSPETDGPWVITMDNVVSEEEAQRMIDVGHEIGYERSSDVGEMRPDGTYTTSVNEGRTSTNAWCNEKCEDDPLTKATIGRLSELTGIPETNSEHIQLLRYEESQKYQLHHDFIPHHRKKQGGVRILTVFLYLNDVEAGGGTNFDKLNITVMPKSGRVLLWPSVLDEAPDRKEGLTTHQALPVEAGIKYGANAWFHQRDFKAANAAGCMG